MSLTRGRVAEANAAYNTLLPPPVSDVDLGLQKLRGVIGDQDPQDMVLFIHRAVPCSKARARWHRAQQRFYTPQNVLDAQSELAKNFEAVVPDRPWTCNIAIVAIFFRPNAQRIDADNLMKLVMDAATQAKVWTDDCLVTTQAAFIELDKENPRTVVALCPTVSSLNRDPVQVRICQRCRQPFQRNRFTQSKLTRYCSNACAQAAALAEVRCPKCETTFKRTVSGQRYCSKECEVSAALVRKSIREGQRPWPKCDTCGGRVSRREYKQCSRCGPKGRRIGSKNKPRANAGRTGEW
jgi:Holliday junction resolvase RusA-like endonuclease